MDDIVIRLAALDDAPAIAALAAQLGYSVGENDVAYRLAELFQLPNRAIYVAAFPAGEVVAWIDLYIHRSLLDNPLVMIGGVVVVEVIFGYPGLGKYIYDAAIFGDYNAVEAAAMVTVTIAVATRLIGDLIYTFLNPRIRYA